MLFTFKGRISFYYYFFVGVLGISTEMFFFGTGYAMSIFGNVLGFVLVAVFFLPVIYPLNLTCINEVSEIRFNVIPYYAQSLSDVISCCGMSVC